MIHPCRHTARFGLFFLLATLCGCLALREPQDPGAVAPYPRLHASPVAPASSPASSRSPKLAAALTSSTSSASSTTSASASSTQTLTAPEDLPIDLPTVLRLAGTDALEIKLAGERLAEAEARRLAADYQFLPVLQPGLATRWHDGRTQAVTGNFLNVDKQYSQAGVSFSAEWRLGELVYQSLAARRRVAAGQAGLQASRDAARLQAVAAFFNLVQARAGRAIVEDRIRQADETVRITQALADAGAGLLSEVRRAQAARAEVRQRLAVARERVRLASLDLTTALDIDPMVTLTPRQEPQDMIVLVSADKPLSALVSAALENRPELEESRARWAALDEERKASILAPLIPALRADLFSGTFGSSLDRAGSSNDYALGLQWNIGRGGAGDLSRTRLARAQQRQESIRFDQLLDAVAREVITQHLRVETAREEIELSKEEVRAAEETLRLSRERQKSGAVLTIEVLSAEDLVFSARLRAAQQVSDFNKAQYGLLRSIGGFHGLK